MDPTERRDSFNIYLFELSFQDEIVEEKVAIDLTEPRPISAPISAPVKVSKKTEVIDLTGSQDDATVEKKPKKRKRPEMLDEDQLGPLKEQWEKKVVEIHQLIKNGQKYSDSAEPFDVVQGISSYKQAIDSIERNSNYENCFNLPNLYLSLFYSFDKYRDSLAKTEKEKLDYLKLAIEALQKYLTMSKDSNETKFHVLNPFAGKILAHAFNLLDAEDYKFSFRNFKIILLCDLKYNSLIPIDLISDIVENILYNMTVCIDKLSLRSIPLTQNFLSEFDEIFNEYSDLIKSFLEEDRVSFYENWSLTFMKKLYIFSEDSNESQD